MGHLATDPCQFLGHGELTPPPTPRTKYKGGAPQRNFAKDMFKGAQSMAQIIYFSHLIVSAKKIIPTHVWMMKCIMDGLNTSTKEQS